jgi:hypothetical protein
VNAAPRTRQAAFKWLQAIVLAAPSVWLLLTLNPWWRDIDGYNQVTLPPGPMTILQFSPLYCFGARIPLYLGCAYEALIARSNFPTLGFFHSPILTDSGVFLLVALQHLLLLVAQLFFLRSIEATPVTKLVLAGFLALNASAYAYNHCVGAEALSVCATLLLLGVVLRISRRRHIKRKQWAWFGLCLILCVLARPINAVFSALLPAVFIIRITGGAIRAFVRRSPPRFPSRIIKRQLWFCAVSLVVALLSLGIAERSTRYLCRAVKIKYRSLLGVPFVWRLNFLAQLTDKERTELLDRMARRTSDPLVKRMIAETTAGIGVSAKWDPQACTDRFVQILEESGITTDLGYQLDLYRNRVASVFLRSFERPFLTAVFADFVSAFDFSPRDVATFPIATTRYCFGRIQEMPQLTRLATFRGNGPDAALAAQQRMIYFRLIDIRFRNLLIVWAALTALLVLTRRGKEIVGDSIAFVCVGVIAMLLTLFLSELLPRFVLPFWLCYVAAMLLYLGRFVDKIVHQIHRRTI